MPGMPLFHGSAHVTAYGLGSQRCTIDFWNGAGVAVQCRTSAGAATNAAFDVAFFQ